MKHLIILAIANSLIIMVTFSPLVYYIFKTKQILEEASKIADRLEDTVNVAIALQTEVEPEDAVLAILERSKSMRHNINKNKELLNILYTIYAMLVRLNETNVDTPHILNLIDGILQNIFKSVEEEIRIFKGSSITREGMEEDFKSMQKRINIEIQNIRNNMKGDQK